MSRRIRGMTLIELLVAITILAILGAFSARAVLQTLKSQEQLEAHYTRWQNLARVFARIDTEIQQIGVRYNTSPAAEQAPAIGVTRTAKGQTQLVFWSLDGRIGAKLTGFEFDGNTLYLLRWMGEDSAPVRTPLLEGVRKVDWFFLTGQQQWSMTWPSPQVSDETYPLAVRLEIEYADVGRISRFFTLQ